ncbi:hypothetical protein BVC71_04805 [Marivivens niveibacter]|uniref:Methyl-accepting chemotaxis protein n=1 Tax=Marivivens niveibacter TaxID=1930667 RepID=A0A251X3B6_9RHOB|nr:methyl-accepting chemotaxis protein [Marivivens niveibacter]OUD10804.1 hypothetical protein BVC71_04805 [Marivivens niveibacter]
MKNARIALKLPILLFCLTITSATVTAVLNYAAVKGWVDTLVASGAINAEVATQIRHDAIANFASIAQFTSLAVLFATTLIIRKMVGPLTTLYQQLSKVAQDKDLSYRVPVNGECEVGKSASASNQMLTVFEDFVTSTAHGAKQMEVMSNSLADASVELARDSHTRSSSVDQLSAMLTETASQAAAAVDAAQMVGASVKQARQSAIDGEKEVDMMVTAMSEISETAQDLAKIMEVINDIAFQTKILALNANVEAARAGVHGKGFAVVANEVGDLARRSADAASRSADLIAQSLDRAELGRTAATTTRDAFGKIVEHVAAADRDIKRIDSVINEQKSAVDVANDTSNLISGTAMNDLERTDQISKAANRLKEQSQDVRSRLEQFKSSANDTKGARYA